MNQAVHRLLRSRPLSTVTTFLLFISLYSASAFSMTAERKVLVTGAGGQTGRLVMKKLLQRPAFNPIGIVRTAESKEGLVKEGVPATQIQIADICDAASIRAAAEGMDAIVICTSGTPTPTGEMTPEGRPVFGYPNGQPEQIDWVGQKHQIDAAKNAGCSHVVICSSMGGTDPENMLNKLARGEDGNGGNILLWKRKAEKYLIDSGMTYTIIHPGGLLNESGGLRELVVGVDDSQAGTENRSIPRADVAELLTASLEHESFKNRSFDARSKPEGDGTVTSDFDKLLTDMKENCDYTLGVIPK